MSDDYQDATVTFVPSPQVASKHKMSSSLLHSFCSCCSGGFSGLKSALAFQRDSASTTAPASKHSFRIHLWAQKLDPRSARTRVTDLSSGWPFPNSLMSSFIFIQNRIQPVSLHGKTKDFHTTLRFSLSIGPPEKDEVWIDPISFFDKRVLSI